MFLNITDGKISVVEFMVNGELKKVVSWSNAPEIMDRQTIKELYTTKLAESGAELIGIKHIELSEVDL